MNRWVFPLFSQAKCVKMLEEKKGQAKGMSNKNREKHRQTLNNDNDEDEWREFMWMNKWAQQGERWCIFVVWFQHDGYRGSGKK